MIVHFIDMYFKQTYFIGGVIKKTRMNFRCIPVPMTNLTSTLWCSEKKKESLLK